MGTFLIAGEALAARADPDASEAPGGWIDAGTELRELERAGDWVRVETPRGDRWWVDGRRLTASPRTASAPIASAPAEPGSPPPTLAVGQPGEPRAPSGPESAPQHRQFPRVLVGAAVVAALLAGLGAGLLLNGSDQTTIAPAPTTIAPAPTTIAPAPTTIAPAPTTIAPAPTTIAPAPTTTGPADDPDGQLAVDQALARQALLTIDDFPEGWVAESPEENTDGEPDPIACFGAGPGSIFAQLDGREVDSPDFSSEPEALSVGQSVVMADDEEMAIAVMEGFGVEGAAECIRGVLQVALVSELDLPPGVTLGQITVDRVNDTIDPTIAIEYGIRVPIQLEGDVIEVFIEVVILRQGRALSSSVFSSNGALFDRELGVALSNTIVERMAVIGS
jgi:hypothetical protein